MGELNSQVTYKPVHKNPMDKNRSPTDTIYLYIFAVLLTAWFILNCTYLFRGDNVHAIMQDEVFINLTNNIQNQAIVTLPTIFHQNGVGLIIWITLSGTTISLLFLKTLNCLPKFWAVIGVIVVALTVVALIVNVFFTIYVSINLQNPPSGIMINLAYSNMKALVQIVFLVTALDAVRTLKLDCLAEIIKKTSHAIFFFPTVFLFGLIIMILCLTVIAFTAVSLFSMDSILSGIFSLLGGIYLIAVICNFGVMVISQCVSTWYWSQNKEELSGYIILKSIGLVGRNHVGSIAFSSTIILPVILSIYVLCTNKFPPPPNSGYKAFLVKWGLIGYASEYALTLIASDGVGVHEATKKVYSLFTRSCAIVLSFCCVFRAILTVFLGIAMLISVGVAIAIFQNNALETTDFMKTIDMYYGLGVYLFVAVIVTAAVAANTVLVNTTEEIEETEEREMTNIQGNV